MDSELPKKCQDFIRDNRDVLILLGNKLRTVDTVKQNQYSHYSEESRRLAMELVEEWISEIWNIAFSASDAYEEENPIYRILDKDTD